LVGTVLALAMVSSGEIKAVLRISVINDSDQELQLQLEGKLIGPWVAELRRLSNGALSQNKTLTLDLEKVWFVDWQGVALLRELADRQVSQINLSQFITQQLKETLQ
jgi:ABC-type transporter Mla MlaB component